MITAEQMQQWRALVDADSEFVVIAPANLRALLAEVKRLRDELDECRSVYGYAHPLGGPGSDEVRYEHS